MFVNDQPLAGMAWLGAIFDLDNSEARHAREMADAGVSIFLAPWHFHQRQGMGPGWKGPGQYDFAVFDLWADRLASLRPDIWLLPRLSLDTPCWWADQHPDELTRYADAPDQIPVFRSHHRNPLQASMASTVWIDDVREVLGAFIKHVEGGPWAGRILGYMLDSGGTEEWVYWGVQAGLIPDYGSAALRYYRAWLRRKYGDESWIGAATIPTEPQRRRGTPGMLRDPAQDRAAIDYEMCLSDIVADNLLAWCTTVKELTQRTRLTGAFSSYLLWHTGLVNPACTNGHLGLRRLLEHPDIDFITGITSYDNRGPGQCGSFMLPVESVQHAGKLVFNEVDVRTHRTASHSSGRYASTGLIHLGPLKDAAESVDVLRREFAHHLIHGAAWWYFDMAGGWYSGPEITAEFQKQRQIAQEALAWDMTSVAQVAGFVSGAAPARHPLVRMHDLINHPSLLALQADRATEALYHAGVPIDWWMVDDLALPEMTRYKVLYFYNATCMTQAQVQALESLKCDDRVLIFVGYPGLSGDSALAPDAASNLVGMRLELDLHRQPARLKPRTYDHPLFGEVVSELALGSGAPISPRLLPRDPQATILAHWPDGEPAVAIRKHDRWTSIFLPVPLDNTEMFRAICRCAGCHIYNSNDDVVFANRSLLAVHFNRSIGTVELPRAMRVTDLFTGQTMPLRQHTLAIDAPGGTHLFRLDPPST